MKKNLNQKLINLIEYYNLTNINLLLSENSLIRNLTDSSSFSDKTKLEKLNKLKSKIKNIRNCDLKSSATNIVFGDGDIGAKIMFIGEGPGAQEDADAFQDGCRRQDRQGLPLHRRQADRCQDESRSYPGFPRCR